MTFHVNHFVLFLPQMITHFSLAKVLKSREKTFFFQKVNLMKTKSFALIIGGVLAKLDTDFFDRARELKQ